MMPKFPGRGAGRLRRFRRRVLVGLVAGTAAAAAVLALRGTYPLRVAELKAYDARVRLLHDPRSADSSIVILAIDDNSLKIWRDQLGRWPWPRDVYAAMLDYVRVDGARAAVFDIFFYEPDLANPEQDEVFAAALGDGMPVVLPFTFSRGSAEAESSLNRLLGHEALVEMLARFAAGAAPHVPADWRFDHAEIPIELLGERAAALGAANFNPDLEDGVARRERLAYAYEGRLYPALPLAAARVLEPRRFGGPIERRDGMLRAGPTAIPLDGDRFLIRWRGPYRAADGVETFRVVPVHAVLTSYQQMLEGRPTELPPGTFRGKTVLIGLTGIGHFEARATPLRPHDPGVLIHATVLDNLLRGDFLRRAPHWHNAAVTAATAFGTAAFIALVPSATLATLGAFLLLLLVAGLGLGAFAAGVWLDLAAPLFAAGLAFAGTMAANYMTEGREKRRVRDLFSRYVSPDYVRELTDNYENVQLGGQRVPLTLLFSDIRGFTSISEKLPAERVVGMLNEYLEKMAEVVYRHGGTLDKFIGDAVMAFWGAPLPRADHARRAVDAGLDMLEELDRLNARWAAEGAGTARLEIGIGINTGEAVVGNIGSLSHKLDYTAIGDTVNLASRLEGLNKQYGTHLIVSESTLSAAGDGFLARPIDAVKVKGKEQSVHIFEVSGRKGARPAPAGSVTLAVLLLGMVMAGPLAGQAPVPDAGKVRWSDRVYQAGSWRGRQFVPVATSRVDSLGLVATVEGYGRAPRWRLEIRRVITPDSLGEAITIVGSGTEALVLTSLGSTPLERHAAASDPLVGAILGGLTPEGRVRQAGTGRIVQRTGQGHIAWVIDRRAAARPDFADNLLTAGTAGRLGRNLLRISAEELGSARSGEVVASAGARGVARVQTVAGVIEIMPDTVGVRRLEGVRISYLDLDRFMRSGRLTPPLMPVREEEPR
jgi:adenylate cyclase